MNDPRRHEKVAPRPQNNFATAHNPRPRPSYQEDGMVLGCRLVYTNAANGAIWAAKSDEETIVFSGVQHSMAEIERVVRRLGLERPSFA